MKNNPVTRRDALRMIGGGFGMMAFAGMVNQSLLQAQSITGIAKLDYPQRVKRVIFLFMNGGMSHVDTFDPKPMLEKYDGQPLPGGANYGLISAIAPMTSPGFDPFTPTFRITNHPA